MYSNFRDKITSIEASTYDTTNIELHVLHQACSNALKLIEARKVCPDCGSCKVSEQATTEDNQESVIRCLTCELEF